MKKSWNSPGHLFSHFRTNPVLTYALVEKRKLFHLKTQTRVIQALYFRNRIFFKRKFVELRIKNSEITAKYVSLCLPSHQ